MQFRLTYEGPLLATTKGNNRSDHKHELRRSFHPQLKQLWARHPLLRGRKTDGPGATPEPMVDHLARRFQVDAYNFVPLVTRDLNVLCGMKILFLRPEPPGEVISSGDIDNRLKTLFDALDTPQSTGELGGSSSPSAAEQPFYTLLEDDKLVSSLSVDTDMLLVPIGSENPNTARLVITVELNPYVATWSNSGF